MGIAMHAPAAVDRILAGSEDGAEKLGMHQQEDDEISLPSLGVCRPTRQQAIALAA